jgi:hypothetical protein
MPNAPMISVHVAQVETFPNSVPPQPTTFHASGFAPFGDRTAAG